MDYKDLGSSPALLSRLQVYAILVAVFGESRLV